MADEKSTGAFRLQTTGEEDARDEARVLREVLFLYPETLTLEELIRELTVASTEYIEQDAVRRAVRDLIAGGLLHQNGDVIRPTRAAVNFSTLMDV
ncbi:MAG: hypothetical protein ACTHK6_07025 [Solirubrobacterales bacterium]